MTRVTGDKTVIQGLGSRLVSSPLRLERSSASGPGGFVPDEARVRYQVETGTGNDLPADVFFERAGPREKLFFEPRQTKAAIGACGGVCRGLNNVIRSTVTEFYYNYGVEKCTAFATDMVLSIQNRAATD
jgi:6-phosphofructokinase 1